MDSITGMKQLLKSLEDFPKQIQKNVMSGAVRAAAAEIAKEAKARVPKKTGNLKKSMGIVKRRSAKKAEIRFSITPFRNKNLPNVSYSKLKKERRLGGYYGHMVEFGTSHSAARPFMLPAFKTKGKDAIKICRKYIAKRLDAEIVKARR